MWQHIEVKPAAHILDFYCFQLCFMNAYWKNMKNNKKLLATHKHFASDVSTCLFY